MLIPTLTQLKQTVHWSDQRLCHVVGVPYGSFRRWKARLAQGQVARFRPGPKKVMPLSLGELRGAVDGLDHGDQRSRGTGALYRHYQAQISRRALAALIATARRALAQQHQAALCHITWQVPGLVWSLDDTELARGNGQLLRLHQVQDLASHYKFSPWVGSGSSASWWLSASRSSSCGMAHRSCSSATTGQSQPARGRRGLGPLLGRAAELAAAVPALQRRDGTRDPRSQSAPAGAAPRQRSAPALRGAALGGAPGARSQPSPTPLAPWPSRLPGVSGCPASRSGVYSAQATGGLR